MGRKEKDTLIPTEEMVRLYEEGVTLREIGQRAGLHERSVYDRVQNWRVRHGQLRISGQPAARKAARSRV
jgi:hypothetical protein